MNVEKFYFHNSLRNWSYLYWFEDNQQKVGYVIDPFAAEPISTFLENHQIKLLAILSTHQHHDHISGNQALQKKFACNIFFGKIPENHSTIIKSFFTPGHCAEHYVYGFYQQNKPTAFFFGDLLFQCGVGRCFQDGDPTTLAQSLLSMLNIVPKDCFWYPGHDYVNNNVAFAKKYAFFKNNLISLKENSEGELANNTLSFELEHNIFLWCLNQENWINIPQDFRGNSPIDCFVRLRSEKDKF